MEILISLVSVIVCVVIDYFIAKEFESIADNKGIYARPYFWWSFLLGFVGWCMVIALPDCSDKNDNILR